MHYTRVEFQMCREAQEMPETTNTPFEIVATRKIQIGTFSVWLRTINPLSKDADMENVRHLHTSPEQRAFWDHEVKNNGLRESDGNTFACITNYFCEVVDKALKEADEDWKFDEHQLGEFPHCDEAIQEQTETAPEGQHIVDCTHIH